jgi:hypothetical protein
MDILLGARLLRHRKQRDRRSERGGNLYFMSLAIVNDVSFDEIVDCV